MEETMTSGLGAEMGRFLSLCWAFPHSFLSLPLWHPEFLAPRAGPQSRLFVDVIRLSLLLLLCGEKQEGSSLTLSYISILWIELCGPPNSYFEIVTPCTSDCDLI